MRFAFVPLLGALLGCSAGSSASTATSTGNDTFPACTRAAGLADADAAASGTCIGARAYVTCTFSSGGGGGGLCDDPAATGCLGTGPGESCADVCAVAEYGVACAGPGPAPSPSPP